MIKNFEQFKGNTSYVVIVTGEGEIQGIYTFDGEKYAKNALKTIESYISRISEADFKEVKGTADDYFDYGFVYENTKDLSNWEWKYGEIVLVRSYGYRGYLEYLHKILNTK